MRYQYNDGGRAEAGFKGTAGDCVCRALAIVTGRSYMDIYNRINELAVSERTGKRKRRKSSANGGVYRTTKDAICLELGGVWTPTMTIGSGCSVHLRDGELPMGRLMVKVSRHSVAVIDGVINDTHDPSRGGRRCVYGYWTFPAI